jgi:molybdenum cofactor biosynthesis protein B
MSVGEHRTAASREDPVRCAVLTVSDSRDAKTDLGGPKVRELLEGFRHIVVDSRIVVDDPPAIRSALVRWIEDGGIEAIITTGGTGISRRDNTADVVRGLIDIELEGYGELMRMLSWEQVGAAAMLSRSLGGLAFAGSASRARSQGVFVFALPGSVKAVELAMTRLIGPELSHLVGERRKPAAQPENSAGIGDV